MVFRRSHLDRVARFGRPPRLLFVLGVMVSLLMTVRVLSYAQGLGIGMHLPILLNGYPLATPTPQPGRVLISEVLYQPSESEPEEEWFELYNAGGLPVSIAEYKIGDEESPSGLEGMFKFPPGTQIQPGQVIVIANRATDFQDGYGFLPDYELQQSSYAVPDLEKYTAWSSGGINLANTGDELLLIDASDHLVDALSWGSSKVYLDPAVMLAERGASLERYPAYIDRDLAQDWRSRASPNPGHVETPPPTPTPSVTPVPTAVPTTAALFTPTPSVTPEPSPAVGHLLISEVLVDPVNDEPVGEWFELYNAGGSGLALSQFKVGDGETPDGLEGMYIFPSGAWLDAGGVCVVANRAQEFYDAYGFLPDYELVESRAQVPNLLPYASWSSGLIRLDNAGDELVLVDGQDQVIDTLSWGSSIWAFNPSVPAATEGHSLERCPSGKDTNLASDWQEQAMPNPGLAVCLPAR